MASKENIKAAREWAVKATNKAGSAPEGWLNAAHVILDMYEELHEAEWSGFVEARARYAIEGRFAPKYP